jgi:hypothetical protein
MRILDEHRFYILLDLVTGDINRRNDEELLTELRSSNNSEIAKAITKTIYAIRCNMFHGNKEFQPVQKEILIPTNIILHRIIECLYEKLSSR